MGAVLGWLCWTGCAGLMGLLVFGSLRYAFSMLCALGFGIFVSMPLLRVIVICCGLVLPLWPPQGQQEGHLLSRFGLLQHLNWMPTFRFISFSVWRGLKRLYLFMLVSRTFFCAHWSESERLLFFVALEVGSKWQGSPRPARRSIMVSPNKAP